MTDVSQALNILVPEGFRVLCLASLGIHMHVHTHNYKHIIKNKSPAGHGGMCNKKKVASICGQRDTSFLVFLYLGLSIFRLAGTSFMVVIQ